MLFEEQIQDIFILPREIKTCVEQAKKAEIGGQSNIREGNHRKAMMTADQLIGQLGEYALSLYLTGNRIAYLIQRRAANNHPKSGDNGEDIFGLNLDIKTSIMRRPDKPALEYRLAVRPKERHKDWCYFLALVQPNGRSGLVPTMTIRVRLMGWISDDELPKKTNGIGSFAGAHIVLAHNLHPLPNLKWFWRS